ncbi:MAG TPA: vanadium nitrogenase [Lachnospiraceae bacterium]|nr:vanadium nitrogenase [Lachnospiraceae bacterium]
MIAFSNMFMSYLIVMLASMAIIVLAVFCGKKLRDRKDAKTARDAVTEIQDSESEEN